jgi:hypothetical protein
MSEDNHLNSLLDTSMIVAMLSSPRWLFRDFIVVMLISVGLFAARFRFLNENLNIFASRVDAKSWHISRVTSVDIGPYSRLNTMCMAVGILWLHILGPCRSDNLVLLGTDHAPAVIR